MPRMAIDGYSKIRPLIEGYSVKAIKPTDMTDRKTIAAASAVSEARAKVHK